MQELLFHMFAITTTNLVFTVTLFIYYYYYYYYYYHFFTVTFLFLRTVLNILSTAKCKNSVFGVLMKISISVLNFSTESAKETTIYELLFLITISSPKNKNKHPSEHHHSHFTITEAFPDLRSILRAGLKYQSNFYKQFFAYKLSYEKKLSRVQSNWLILKETPA